MIIRPNNLFTLIFYIIFIGVIIEPINNIGVDKNSFLRVYFMGIPFRDLTLIFSLVLLSLNSKHILKIINPKIILFVTLALLILLVHSVYMGTITSPHVRADLRKLFWFYGGLSFGYIWLQTGRFNLHLKIVLFIIVTLFVISAVSSSSYYEYKYFGSLERVSHPNIYIFSGLLVPLLILFFNINRQTFLIHTTSIAYIVLFVYFGAILPQTRSMLILAFLVISLYYFSHKNMLSIIQKPFSKTKMYMPKIILVFPFAIGALFMINYFVEKANRLTSEFSIVDIMNDSRAIELIDFFQQSSNSQLLMGRGLGAGIKSFVYNYELTNTLHIGFLNIWLKFGFFPFIILFCYLIFYLPYKYYYSFKHYNLYATVHWRLIIPMIFPWIVSLILSGGFGEINFLFVGLIIFLFSEVNRHGIIRITGTSFFKNKQITNN